MTFVRGDSVRIAERLHAGHHRTPGYLKGKRGTVMRGHGSFRNPETHAYGDDGLPELPLYLVEFLSRDVFPEGKSGERIYADIFEHWLEPAS